MVYGLGIIIPIWDGELKHIPEDAQPRSNRIKTWTGLSACNQAHEHEGHADRVGRNPDYRTVLPLHWRVLDVEGISKFTWFHFSFSTRLSFIYVFIHSSNI